MSALAFEVIERARRADVLIAAAESCTGGGLAMAITEIPGSSDVFERGFVTYSNAAKRDLLGVKAESLSSYGAVSESVAWEMAEGALERSHAQIAVSITGIAGPGGSEAKPEGRVCFGLAREDARTEVCTVEFGALGRSAVRAASVDRALRMLIDALEAMAAPPARDGDEDQGQVGPDRPDQNAPGNPPPGKASVEGGDGDAA